MPLTRLRWWLPLAVAATVAVGTAYAAGQTILRGGADEPQVQLAEDAAARLDRGEGADAVVPAQAVDLDRSLAPWLMVYDRGGHLVRSSAGLGSGDAPFPTSVLGAVSAGGRRTVTWQPAPGVRSATVTVPYRAGWVVAGRSLRLVEQREQTLLTLVTGAWLAALALTAAAVALAVPAGARLSRPASPAGGPSPAGR